MMSERMNRALGRTGTGDAADAATIISTLLRIIAVDALSQSVGSCRSKEAAKEAIRYNQL